MYYVFYHVFSSPTPPRFSHILTLQLYVFLSPFFKETSPKLKIKTNTHRPNMAKHAKTKQNETKSPQKSMEFLLWLANYFCPVGLPWRVAGIPSDSPLKRTDFPLPADSSLVRSDSLRPFLLSAENMSGSNLCQLCVCCHRLCQSVCALLLLCWEDTMALGPSLSLAHAFFL